MLYFLKSLCLAVVNCLWTSWMLKHFSFPSFYFNFFPFFYFPELVSSFSCFTVKLFSTINFQSAESFYSLPSTHNTILISEHERDLMNSWREALDLWKSSLQIQLSIRAYSSVSFFFQHLLYYTSVEAGLPRSRN